MYVKEKSTPSQLGEFGFIQSIVIGAIQTASLGAATAVHSSSVKKYLKTEKHTVLRSGAAALELKKQELADRERLLQIGSQTELLKDVNIKKLVILGSVTVSVLTIIGVVIYYTLAVGGEDE